MTAPFARTPLTLWRYDDPLPLVLSGRIRSSIWLDSSIPLARWTLRGDNPRAPPTSRRSGKFSPHGDQEAENCRRMSDPIDVGDDGDPFPMQKIAIPISKYVPNGAGINACKVGTDLVIDHGFSSAAQATFRRGAQGPFRQSSLGRVLRTRTQRCCPESRSELRIDSNLQQFGRDVTAAPPYLGGVTPYRYLVLSSTLHAQPQPRDASPR